jgi:uncharacterized short protein YbdD (DUF466 family)
MPAKHHNYIKMKRTRKTRRQFYRLRTRAPYTAAGKTTLRATWQRSGVYRIFENGKLVYVGFSGTNLYRTMYRHFQEWNHPGQPVVTYAGKRKKYTVQVTLCPPAKAAKLERAIIIRNRPKDNPNKYPGQKLTDKELETYNDWEKEQVIADKDLPF